MLSSKDILCCCIKKDISDIRKRWLHRILSSKTIYFLFLYTKGVCPLNWLHVQVNKGWFTQHVRTMFSKCKRWLTHVFCNFWKCTCLISYKKDFLFCLINIQSYFRKLENILMTKNYSFEYFDDIKVIIRVEMP